MSSVVVALMVLVLLLVALGGVLLISKTLRREVDKVHSGSPTTGRE